MGSDRAARRRAGDRARRPHRLLLAALLLGLVVYALTGPDEPTVGGPAMPAEAPADQLVAHFLDVGQGDATLLVGPDAAMLVDAGRHDAADVVDHLRRLEVTELDVVAVTHPHADHLGQLDRVLSTVDVSEIWWPGTAHPTRTFERALDAIEASDAAYEEPRAGQVTSVGSLEVRVLHPEALTDDPHADMLVLQVTFGEVSILFTGDAEADAEQALVDTFGGSLASTVYQVGHHGSSTSTSPAFLETVSPEVAVYSAGAGNPYGHPHTEVVERLVEAGEVYGTDVHGTVTVTTDGVDYLVDTQRRGDIAPQ